MKPFLRPLLLLYSVLMIALSSQAHIINYGINEGMPDNTANCLAQDKRGFIWIGTSNGLARFDGLFFSVFRHDNLNQATISNNNIHVVLPMDQGIYVASDRGVDFYDYADNQFHKCTSTTPGLDSQLFTSLINVGGRVFATTEKGSAVGISATRMERITSKKIYLLAATADGVFALGDGIMYLFTPDMRKILSSRKAEMKWRRETTAYYSSRMKRLFVGSGIGTQSYAYQIVGKRLSPASDHVPSNLRAVADGAASTAFATDGHGVMLRSADGDRWLTQDKDGICGDAIYSLMHDRSGNLWIGSYRTGMTLLSSHKEIFSSISESAHTLPFDLVTAVAASGDNVYIGMDGGGLGIYSPSSKKLSVLTSANSGLWGDNITSTATDGQTVWMAVFDKGLVAYDTHSGNFTNYRLPLKSKSGDVIWSVCYDGAGVLWIGGRDVFVMDTRTGKMRIVPGLVGSQCHSFSVRGEYVWMASSNGLYKVNRKTLKVVEHLTMNSERFKLPSNNVKYAYADSRGRVWVSMCDAALCSIDERRGEMKEYGESQGLDNYVVAGIAESRHGYMVFSTGNGLYYYFPASDMFMRCDTDNDIAVSYNYGAVCSNGGLMFFGSTRGLVMYTDVPMRPRTLFSDVSFSSLDVTNGRMINLSGNSPQEVVLESDENFFSVAFSVPEYTAPHALRFSYYLKGMETEWNEMTSQRTANYTNVPPGSYELLVRCTNLKGDWTRVSTLRIKVLPPWYLTWWAKLLWTILVAAIVTMAVRIYLYQLKIRHKMEIAEVEKESQRQLDNAKMTFFTNITHELRTPVFLIAAQIEELIDRRNSVVSVPSSYLYSMQRSTRKLNQLISRAIDFRKMDEGKLQLKRERVDVVNFAKKIAEDYEDLCDQKNIAFKLDVPEHKVMVDIDREKVEMCINNLISNAYKYTKPNGHVALKITERQGEVVFSVKDDGIGIVPEARENIFGNFYRTERGKAYGSGDGIGLSFVKTLVEMHGGRVWLESEVNVGSEFFFSIPTPGTTGNTITDAATTTDDATPAPNDAAITTDIERKDISDTANALGLEGATSSDEPRLQQETKTKAAVKSNPSATHTLLLIDDDRDTIELLERNLIDDFTVLKAYDGDEGLKVAAASLPDLIVCDMMMPGLDGLGFLQTLKNDKKLQHIKVIILTGQTSEEERIAAYDAGADAYLTKPVSLKLLRARINRMIAESDNAALTTELSREKRSYTKEEQIFLLRCREIIDTNMTNPDFSVDFLAEKLAMSHSSLYKKLKQMTGMSLIEFVNDYKIFKAVQMFKEGQTCVERVAEQCGFGDVKNFRNLFKRKMQMTPKQYVQSL